MVGDPRSRNDLEYLPHLLLTVLAVRLAAMGLTPLADTTEARYGEIARLMAATGDWITPQVSLGVPFWAKPPLATWLSAASLSAFGVNEFAARLPSLVLGIVVLWLLYQLARTEDSRRSAWVAVVVLATMPLFFVSIGAVMTDLALLVGTTLSMVAFWISVTSKQPRTIWRYAFFVGLAVGLLAKGPIGLVMTGVPLGLWTLVYGRWALVWARLPWIRGLLLTTLLTLPWYVAAELKTPGFLEYFIVGEHWKRFVVSGWQGDRYGSAHARPHGTIWLYWLLATVPWSVVAALASLTTAARRSTARSRWKQRAEWHGYLSVWTLTPMLFFTLAGNILWTYVLTGLPAFALIVAHFLSVYDASARRTRDEAELPTDAGPRRDRIVPRVALAVTSLAFVALILILAGLTPPGLSQKALVAEYDRQRDDPDARLVYVGGQPASAAFYSNGRALLIEGTLAISELARQAPRDFFAVRNPHDLPTTVLNRTEEIGRFGAYRLLRER